MSLSLRCVKVCSGALCQALNCSVSTQLLDAVCVLCNAAVVYERVERKQLTRSFSSAMYNTF